MGALFSKKVNKAPSKSRITEQDRAILELKKQRDQLRLYQRKIDLEQEKLKQLAKECLRLGKKDKAKLILRKKRRQESLLAKTEQQIDNLETMANDIEFAQLEVNVAEGLKVGNASLKNLHNLMSIEDVEKIMEDTQEGIEYQRELDSILSGSLTEEDEDLILTELDELLGLDQELPEVPSTKLPAVGEDEPLEIPEVPTTKLPKVEREAPAPMLAS